jgi:hypothetical protein
MARGKLPPGWFQVQLPMTSPPGMTSTPAPTGQRPPAPSRPGAGIPDVGVYVPPAPKWLQFDPNKGAGHGGQFPGFKRGQDHV